MRSSVYIGCGLRSGSSIQARRYGVQSAAWTCTKLPRATRLRRRCVWSSSTPLRRHEPYPGAACHVYYRGQSSLLSRCPTNLEWNSVPDDVISTESLPTFQRQLKRFVSNDICSAYHFRAFVTDISHLQWTLQWLRHSKNTFID